MLKKRLKVLLFSGLGAMGLCLVTWGGMSVVAKQQTAEMDAIAAEFFKDHPATEQNDSAKTLDQLSAKLGLNLLSNSTNENLPVPEETADLQPIRKTVSDYFRAQKIKEQGPLDPIPATVQTYLRDNQATLTQIQQHLNAQAAPVWHFDADLYADFEYPLPSYLGLRELHQLLVLKAATHTQQNQPEQMVAALDAAQVLIEVPAQRPDLISYLMSLIAIDDTMAIMRHLDGVPTSVSQQLLVMEQQQLGVERLRFNNWSFYRSLNRAMHDPARVEALFSPADLGLAILPGVVFEKPYFAIANVNTTRLLEKFHGQMMSENICSLDIDALDETLLKETPWWNVMAQIAVPGLMSQWRHGGDRMLGAELTHHVVQAKALAVEQGQWPETLPNLASQTCPGESWTYAVTPDGEMSLSFSQDLSEQRPGEPDKRLPLTYQASLAQ